MNTFAFFLLVARSSNDSSDLQMEKTVKLELRNWLLVVEMLSGL
ncbi:hypothetical protein [Halobacillus seohaensis]